MASLRSLCKRVKAARGKDSLVKLLKATQDVLKAANQDRRPDGLDLAADMLLSPKVARHQHKARAASRGDVRSLAEASQPARVSLQVHEGQGGRVQQDEKII